MDGLSPHLLAVATILTVTPPSWGELGAYFVAAVSLAGSWVVARIGRKTGSEANRNAREANAITAAEKLWKRVDELEKRDRERDVADRAKDERMDELEESQKRTDQKLADALTIISVAVDFIGELYRWGRRGGGEPEPTIPEQLYEWLRHLMPKKEE